MTPLLGLYRVMHTADVMHSALTAFSLSLVFHLILPCDDPVIVNLACETTWIYSDDGTMKKVSTGDTTAYSMTILFYQQGVLMLCCCSVRGRMCIAWSFHVKSTRASHQTPSHTPHIVMSSLHLKGRHTQLHHYAYMLL